MEIYCELQEIEDGKTDFLKGGKYLSIKTDHTGTEPVFLLLKDFRDECLKNKNSFSVVPTEPGVGSALSVTLPQPKVRPNLEKVLKFVNEKIKINKDNLKDNKIVVHSDLPSFLELPWENIVDDELYIIRKIIPLSVKKEVDASNNLVLLMSHAHEGVGHDIKNEMDKEIKSIYNSVHFLTENNQQYFRIDNILLSKHTTCESLKKISWGDYNMVHLIMHGDQDGNLCLENEDPQKYKQVNKFSSEEFIDLIKGNQHTLIFLSVCYTGGSMMNEESLAFKIVKAGYSKYVIAYRDPVGEVSAKSFTESFYRCLISGKDMEEVYKDSLKSYYSGSIKREYIPLLYSSI